MSSKSHPIQKPSEVVPPATFFKNLSHHLAVFEDEQDLKNGGYIFKEARPIFENFSVEITEDIENKKKELEEAKNIYPSMLKRQYYNI